MTLTHLLPFIIAVTEVATDEVPRPVWEIVLMMAGGAATGCTLAVIAWKVAKPHVKNYVESVVQPLQETADRVHAQVTPNGGRSNHDYARKSYEAATEAKDTAQDVLRLAHRNARKIDELNTRFGKHEEAGGAFIREALPRLREAGIVLDDLLADMEKGED